MARVFISYSTRNQELAECFIEFIRLGMGVPKSDIFCTAFPEALPTGENFIEKIRTELESCDAVISLITEEYMRSTFCIVEMGIAWGMRKCYFPLLFVPYERLNSTPLCGVQMRCLDSREDISTVYDELFESHVIKGRQTAEFNRRLPAFIERMSGLKQGDYRIGRDKDGYYTAVIREVRKVSDNYRCYGIKGQIQDPPDEGEANSDWIFFWRGVYPDLQVGDWVRFKVSKSEVRQFPDIGSARNLYPSELEKCSGC